MSNLDPQGQLIAAALAQRYIGTEIDLDESVPFDIYDLFKIVTGRDYNCMSNDDELTILEYASAFERTVWGDDMTRD